MLHPVSKQLLYNLIYTQQIKSQIQADTVYKTPSDKNDNKHKRN